MLKILSIEILLSAVLGAILFRLVCALTRSNTLSWAAVVISAGIILFFVPGHVDERLIVEYGGKLPLPYELSPLVVNLLRCLGLVAGAWLASLAVAKRKKMGLEDEPPYDDFP
ncbi:hypothetical protein DFR30_1253 [Thiogranum longum]|uniref:Uncharacterized protein n=1 Tax=Thiogranum longum TaxID=1537524 RepID=A0A4R1H832_9GAMM|nr:hypothetical protein [Thiogranum longum]TCK17994.1 hypothetical protein DFR30_1253 [Thiogranum longum]